jgi:hypothetical protein
VRADGLATPATSFEADRAKLEAAIRASEPSSTALHLPQALAFAQHVLSQDGRNRGEIAFAGSNRTVDPDAGAAPPPNLRALLVNDPVDNCGLRKIGLRRSAADPDVWEIFVSARNYSASGDRSVIVSVDFGPPQAATRVPVGSRRLALSPGSDGEADFTWRTSAAGILGVTLTPHDAFPEDDHVELELPAQPTLAVTVYSAEPDLLRPVLSSLPHVVASYRKPEEYRSTGGGLVILDRFAPAERPHTDSVWIDPPAAGSPVLIRTHVQNVPFARWDGGDPLSAGMRARISGWTTLRFSKLPPATCASARWKPARWWWRGRASPRSPCLDFIPDAPACAIHWPRRCCLPTWCAGCRRRFSGARNSAPPAWARSSSCWTGPGRGPPRKT